MDMLRVNDSSIKDAYPIRPNNAILEKLIQARYISTLDLKHGYWQVPLNKESHHSIHDATNEPFSVSCLAYIQLDLQRLLDQIIGTELEPHAFAYLDDLVVV